MKRVISALAIFLAAAAWNGPALMAFCGFYVAKADTKLFNKASQVVLVRQGDRTVLTMANDFKGDPKEFAVVIPVPSVLQKEQIHIGEKALLDHLDAYSAPRLVEYFDADPCQMVLYDRLAAMAAPSGVAGGQGPSAEEEESLGVDKEARSPVGKTDILILAEHKSSEVEKRVRKTASRLPAGAGEVLTSYVNQNLKFFGAKINNRNNTRLNSIEMS